MAWRGTGDSTVYKACSGADRAVGTWTQYAVRHQLPVQLDDGLSRTKVVADLSANAAGTVTCFIRRGVLPHAELDGTLPK